MEKMEAGSVAAKSPRDSRAENVRILLTEDLNGYGRLFGGRLMEWADITAAVVARRHCEKNVTTVFVDDLQFLAPAYSNDTLVLKGSLTYVGNTSMEVRVDTYVESLAGVRKLVNRAHLVLIALDENEQPTKVPKLLLETQEEQAEFELGRKRAERRRCIRVT